MKQVLEIFHAHGPVATLLALLILAVIAQAGVIVFLFRELRKSSDARVEDAKESTKVLEAFMASAKAMQSTLQQIMSELIRRSAP